MNETTTSDYTYPDPARVQVIARASATRRWGVALAAVLAAVVLLALLLVTRALGAADGFLHVRRNLSNTSQRISSAPDLAVSPDRDWVGVSWVEGYSSESGRRGNAYLRAASETGGDWQDAIKVYPGDTNACAFDRTAVAITGTTAHVAYTVYNDTCSDPDNSRLYYRACDLTANTCGGSQIITQTQITVDEDKRITWVDITVDEAGNPHVAFARYDDGTGKIFYAARSGGGWSSAEAVSEDGDNNTPSIAWGSGCAHVVWENEDADEIRYRRRCTGTWSDSENMYSASAYPPHKPHIAAADGGKVFITWDVRYEEGGLTWPATYALLYRRSNDNGDNFEYFKEIGTDLSYASWNLFTEYQAADESQNSYLSYLQPSIALNDESLPVVTWHAAGVDTSGEQSGVYYSYAISGTSTAITWSTPTRLTTGVEGSTAVGFGAPISDTLPLLHVTYMGKASSGSEWDVFYNSNPDPGILTVYLPLVLRNHGGE